MRFPALPLALALCLNVVPVSVHLPDAPLGAPIVIAAEDSPEAIVEAIYAQWADPCCNYFNVIDAHFTPSLKKLYRDVEAGSQMDVEFAIDFDIFLNAQDEDTVTNVTIMPIEETADTAALKVTYTAFGEEKTGTYDFVKTAEGWKIDDMGWGEDRKQLRPMLDDLKESQRKSR
jgi:hypothetical protein